MARILRTSMLTTMAALAALILAAAASAAGTAVKVGTPLEDGPPSAAVDGSGDAVLAWANTKDLNGATNFVQYCVLPTGSRSCSHSGSLVPADGAQFIDGVQVLSDGPTLVILADEFGTAGDNGLDYVPVQEWQSTDGGATWSIQDGGLSVTSGILNGDTVPVGGVIVPGTDTLGFGWDTAGPSPPTFNAFPLHSPPECSRQTCAAGFAQLQPPSNPDQVGNPAGAFASELGPTPGVMGIFMTNFTNGPLACQGSLPFGFAYAYASGPQSAANNYNISPGSAGSAWRVPVTEGDCNVEYEAVAGGPSGFGVLENDEAHGTSTSTTVYHRFDQASARFDGRPATVNAKGEQQPAVSQDGKGGIYATYVLTGVGGPITLSYSDSGGSGWTSGTLNPDGDQQAANTTSAVNSAGQGWAVWNDNGSVMAQSFKAADAVTPATVGRGATSNGQAVTLNVSCASFPCTITATVTAPGIVNVHKSLTTAAAARAKAKARTVKLGSGKLTIRSKGAKKLSVRLSSAGKKLLRSRKGHLKITVALRETVQKHSVVSTHSLTLTIKKPKKK